MKNSAKHSKGFTLVEVLIALSIAGIVLTVITAFFITQSRTYNTHNQVVELQQGLRVSLLRMERELRQTGYNPGGLTEAAAGSDGLDNNCNGSTDESDNTLTAFVDESESIGFKVALSNTVRFSLDKDGNGSACGEQEDISYALNGTTLERNGTPRLGNVEVLNFVYLDKNGAIATKIEDIRSVQIAMIGRTRHEDTAYKNTRSYQNLQGTEILSAPNDGFRRWMLTSQVNCRNLDD